MKESFSEATENLAINENVISAGQMAAAKVKFIHGTSLELISKRDKIPLKMLELKADEEGWLLEKEESGIRGTVTLLIPDVKNIKIPSILENREALFKRTKRMEFLIERAKDNIAAGLIEDSPKNMLALQGADKINIDLQMTLLGDTKDNIQATGSGASMDIVKHVNTLEYEPAQFKKPEPKVVENREFVPSEKVIEVEPLDNELEILLEKAVKKGMNEDGKSEEHKEPNAEVQSETP